MNILPVVKTVATFVVSTGTGTIVANAIKASNPANANVVQKICLGVGGVVLSGMVADRAAAYTEGIIDNVSDDLAELKGLKSVFAKK